MSAYSDAIIALSPGGYWRMGESSGDLADSSGNSNTAVDTGSPTYSVAAGLFGDANTAVSLPGGATAYFTATEAASIDTGDTFSVIGRFKRGALTGEQMLISRPNAGATAGYDIRLTTAGALQLVKTFVAAIVTSTVLINETTNWHSFAVTKATTTSRLYLDGVDVTGTVTNATINAGVGDIQFGRSIEEGDKGWNGALDEFAVFKDIALTPTQIANVVALSRAPQADDDRRRRR